MLRTTGFFASCLSVEEMLRFLIAGSRVGP